jgi:hypothetical protein
VATRRTSRRSTGAPVIAFSVFQVFWPLPSFLGLQEEDSFMMRKKSVIAIAAFVVVAFAFGAGILMQRQYQVATIRAAEEFGRNFAGLNDSVPPSPRWEEWHYPRAESKGSIQGSSARVNGKLVRPAGRYAIFVTADAFEDVARFYAEKAGFEQPDDVAKSHLAVSSHGTLQGESNHLLDDFSDVTDPQKLRPVRVKCLIRRCPSYDLTVVITRADDENYTHLGLFYDPHTESDEAAR